MTVRIAINGFGRIGRNVMRHICNDANLEVVFINDPSDIDIKAHLLQYDSNYGIFEQEVSYKGTSLFVNGKQIDTMQERDPSKLPWKDYNVDFVVESTGALRTREDAEKHLTSGAGKVIITAPAKDVDATVVLGVNEDTIDKQHHKIISNASCTTNCLAPVVKVLQDNFGIEKGLMTTTHSYTGDQVILDARHKDPRRARACALSMIPTTTGAARAVGEVIPAVKGKIDGFALRVPTPTVSVVDLNVILQKPVTVELINDTFRKAVANDGLGRFLKVSELPLVSIDYKKNPASSTVDLLSTMVMGDTLVKILSWYDNEWGYSSRVVDLIRYITT